MYEENNKIEFKSAFIDDIKQEIIAFLNSEGGIIYVGINDDGSINQSFVCENHDKINLKLSSWIQEAFYPKPSSLIKFEFNQNGILEINISEGVKKPYYLREKGLKPSGVYKRVGSSKRKASEDEILKMIIQSSDYDFESDKAYNQNLKFDYFNKICNEKNISISQQQKINFGLINSNDEYTNIGLLISDNSPLEIKVSEYDREMNFKVKKIFKGSLLKVLEETEEIVERLNDVSAAIDGSSFERKEIVSYPGASLREMVLNAFCHSDFSINSNIKIEFFYDKVKITSPGGLFRTTLKEILKGVQTYRNPKLVHILDKMGYIENFGTGIPRTLEAYKNSEKNPEFFDGENFFIVYLPNLNWLYKVNQNRDVGIRQLNRQLNRQINRQIMKEISKIGIEIIKIIQSNPGINVPGVYKNINNTYPELNISKIQYILKTELKQYIKHKKSKKTGGYYLK